MKTFTKQIVILLLVLFSQSTFSQTEEERKTMQKKFNMEEVNKLTSEIKNYSTSQQQAVKELIAKGYAKEELDQNGSFKELVGAMENGTPLYNTIQNQTEGIATRAATLYKGGKLGLDINREGMVAYIWDGGRVRTTRQEFIGTGKITEADDANEPAGLNSRSFHATHVCHWNYGC